MDYYDDDQVWKSCGLGIEYRRMVPGLDCAEGSSSFRFRVRAFGQYYRFDLSMEQLHILSSIYARETKAFQDSYPL